MAIGEGQATTFAVLDAELRREAVEILRDPIRIAFALLGPIILMFAFGYGISFDIEHLRFAVFDQSRSLESREFLESFEGSRFFERQPDKEGEPGVLLRVPRDKEAVSYTHLRAHET